MRQRAPKADLGIFLNKVLNTRPGSTIIYLRKAQATSNVCGIAIIIQVGNILPLNHL